MEYYIKLILKGDPYQTGEDFLHVTQEGEQRWVGLEGHQVSATAFDLPTARLIGRLLKEQQAYMGYEEHTVCVYRPAVEEVL